MSTATAMCPPHYWLVEERAGGDQHWACYRCGEEREQPLALPADRPNPAWVAYTPRPARDASE